MAGALAAYNPYGKYAAVRARGQGNAVRARDAEKCTNPESAGTTSARRMCDFSIRYHCSGVIARSVRAITKPYQLLEASDRQYPRYSLLGRSRR